MLSRFVIGPIHCFISLGLSSFPVLPVPYLLGRLDDLYLVLVRMSLLLLAMVLLLLLPMLLLLSWVPHHVRS